MQGNATGGENLGPPHNDLYVLRRIAVPRKGCQTDVMALEAATKAEVVAPLSEASPTVALRIDGHHPPGRGSYAPVGFTVTAEDRAEVAHAIGIGGCTDWTRQLLGRAEEQLLVSTIATEQLGEGFGGSPANH